jgi:hypothetical protein
MTRNNIFFAYQRTIVISLPQELSFLSGFSSDSEYNNKDNKRASEDYYYAAPKSKKLLPGLFPDSQYLFQSLEEFRCNERANFLASVKLLHMLRIVVIYLTLEASILSYFLPDLFDIQKISS